MSTNELNSSELGTQEFWDDRYKSEIINFRNNGDVGEVWFGEGSIFRICKWIFKNALIKKDYSIIDIGCGNGIFLIELAKNNFTNLLGVDYSNDAIILAKEIAKKEQVNINYKVFDILTDENKLIFNLIHDKGTYDAISLSQDSKKNREIYIENVNSMLATNGFFIITSCNWTKEELANHFSDKFVINQIIPTPQFKFGGQTGNSVTSIVFTKK